MDLQLKMPAKQQMMAERGRSSYKGKGKKRGILSRSVSFRQQQTVVFHGGPRDVLPSAVLLGDVDNDHRGDAEVAVGGVDGTLAIFKSSHVTSGPYLLSSGLGKLTTLALGPLLLGHSEIQQLIACAGEGVCHIFNIRPLDVRWDSDSCCGRVQPLWSIPCPRNVTACCIADVNGDRRQEVIVGTQDGVVHVLSFEVNPDGEGDSNGEGASEKDARARKETASSTPHPREEASSGAYSPSIPLMEGLALEHGGEWLEDVEDACDHAVRAAMEISEPSTEVSELHWEDGKRTPSPTPNIPGGSAAGPTGDTRAREWLENSPEDHPEDHPENTSTGTGGGDVAPPLNPHFKSLLQLPARSSITSLAIVHYPGSNSVIGKTGPAPDPTGINTGNVIIDDILLSDQGESEEQRGCSLHGSAEYVSSGERLEASLRAHDHDSAEGVYVVVGLEAGGFEVMRLSSRRPGTRFFDLVDDPSDNTADGDNLAEEHPFEDHRFGENHPRCGDECFEAKKVPAMTSNSVACTAASAFVANIGFGEGDPALETCPIRLEDGLIEGNLGGRRGASSSFCDWRVPVEKNATVPRALLGEQGWGLVVDMVRATSVARTSATVGNPPGSLAATPTGTPPLARPFLGGSGWGAFHGKDGAAEIGGADGEEGDERAFAFCLSGRCVGYCRVVSTAEGLPRWRVIWTRQTEESLMACQTLGCSNGEETLLVACSFSGNTIIFSSDGSHCVEFNPGQFLTRPLTAFVAGYWTTPSAFMEPSLVYVSTGGEVVVYHGLAEKVESMKSAQFLPTLHENGSIDILRSLLENLAERLRWRSNQGDLLFPPLPPPSTDPHDGVSVDSGPDPAAATSIALSDEEREDSALSLPDAILARAVLCPVGIARATRGRDRRRNSGDGGAGGGAGGGGSGASGGVAGYVVDDERWRREARALAKGEGGTVTVGEGAAAAERVIREIRAWEDSGREPTLRTYPCLRETLAALTLWGSGSRRELLRSTLRDAEMKATSP